MSKSDEERKRSESAKKAAETRRKNQEAAEEAEREAHGPQKDTTPSGPVDAGPDSTPSAPANPDN